MKIKLKKFQNTTSGFFCSSTLILLLAMTMLTILTGCDPYNDLLSQYADTLAHFSWSYPHGFFNP